MMQDLDIVLEVEDLHTQLVTKTGTVRAVDGISFRLHRGETLGIVGESGSGKSMTALSIVRLLPRPAGRIVSGSVQLEGEELTTKSEQEMRRVRGRQIAMILQDPQTSLNPVFPVGWQIVEALQIRHRVSREKLRDQAVTALRNVQVAAPERRVDNYPHEMSGGMKQRVVGAIALSSEPKVLIADEPTTSLDVTVQAQYLNLLQEMKREAGVSLIFITHDFGIVANMCDRVAVMYAGRIVEIGPVQTIFDQPAHPYTAALMKSVPSPERKVDRLVSIEGQPPMLWDLPRGCRFADRCPFVMPHCRENYPPTRNVSNHESTHTAACWLLESE